MKKKGVLILIVLFSLILLSIFANLSAAQDDVPLPSEVRGLHDAGEKLSDEEQRTEYLKQEWTKILENNAVGRGILYIGKIFQVLSPVFKLLIGIEFSFSWMFFLSLGAWTAILILIYNPIKNIFQVNPRIALSMSIIIPAIAAQFGTIQMIVGFFVPLLKNKWMIGTSILIAALLLYVYSLFMKKFGEVVKESQKKEDEKRREQKAKTVEEIHDIEIKATRR